MFSILFSHIHPTHPQSYATDEITQIYDKCVQEIEQHLHALMQAGASTQHIQVLQMLLEAVVLARNSREIVTALALLQKVRNCHIVCVWEKGGSNK